MYKINYKNLKKGYTYNLMIFTIGIIFLTIITYGLFQGVIKKASMDGEVKAYKVKVQSRGVKNGKRATYHYMVDGQEYVYTLPNYPKTSASTLKAKDTIYYKTENPSICVSEYETRLQLSGIFAIVLMLAISAVGVKGILDTRKRIQKVKWLSENGTLIPGLKYKMVSDGRKVKNKSLMKIQVEYELTPGKILKLTGEPRYDFKSYDSDGLVDLLIDLNDTNNYYIDFNIM